MKIDILGIKNKSMFFIIAMFISCATIKPTSDKVPHPSVKPTMTIEYQAPPVIKPSQRDTVPAKRRLTQQEIQQYLRTQYKLNYDELIGPDMKKLYGIIESQAQSFHYMTVYMQETRRRTDSIARERNHYRSVSINNDTVYQNKIIALQNQLLKQNKEWRDASKQQIDFNTIVAVSCLIGVGVLVIVIALLWYRVNKLYKKIVTYA